MNGLHENTPVYHRTTEGGWSNLYNHDEVQHDDYGVYNSEWEPVEYSHDVPAKWWSVAVYDVEGVYGGPEEGGWWYTAGYLVQPMKIRVFEDFEEAHKYLEELHEWCQLESSNYQARGYTEELPLKYFPKVRPRYS